MSWKRLYRESEEKFDYTTILFPNKDYGEKGRPEIIDNDGSEYVMASAEFEALNSSWLGEMNVNFIYEVEAEGHWSGSYRAATREEPEEYPDFEVTDTWSDVVRIEMSDGETTIDITDRFPTKEQAEKDGNGKWYEEYSSFIKDMGEYAEEHAAERLNENPPEDTRYEDYWDDREDWDESSMCNINENSLPM